ncbi:hypothetical protein L873DRAFT_1714130 [Choiromyces venosus 120613-1]|uniref:Uncharacterized protein n=1 Tax=Choiromyces venosus 120613-1 TaxID=1336337 RepID=A0A3N4J032_9PEZI|nr:hypothetical protein L873DRAFT_1714130 [Choiromyces venosus 120613-1]
MDILVRTSQAGSIYQTLAQSGEWLEVDKSTIPKLAMLPESGEHHSVGWFKRYDDQWYICLCSEDTYRLTVDTEKIQVPRPVSFNRALVESEFHPNPKDRIPHDRSSLPYLITDEDVKFVWGEPITFPVLIPTIPEYLDSCLNRIRKWGRTCCIPQMDIDNLARYRVLDSPLQQEKPLSKVENTGQLTEYFTQRQRRQEKREDEEDCGAAGETCCFSWKNSGAESSIHHESTVRLYSVVIGRQYVELQFIDDDD